MEYNSRQFTVKDRSQSLYNDHYYRQRAIHVRQASQKQAEEVAAAKACTFRPHIDPVSNSIASEILGDESVFQRLSRARSPSPDSPKLLFTPMVNHNLDDKLNEWAQGIGVHERLFGEALYRIDHVRELQLKKEEESRRDATQAKSRSSQVNDKYERALAELNGMSDDGLDDHQIPAQFSGRYLEDPKLRDVRLTELKSKVEPRFSFAPEIHDCPPDRATSVTETLTSRLRAETHERARCLGNDGVPLLESAYYRQRRDTVLASSERYSRVNSLDRILGKASPPRCRHTTRHTSSHNSPSAAVLRRLGVEIAMERAAPKRESTYHKTTCCKNRQYLENAARSQMKAYHIAHAKLLDESRLSWEQLRRREEVATPVQTIQHTVLSDAMESEDSTLQHSQGCDPGPSRQLGSNQDSHAMPQGTPHKKSKTTTANLLRIEQPFQLRKSTPLDKSPSEGIQDRYYTPRSSTECRTAPASPSTHQAAMAAHVIRLQNSRDQNRHKEQRRTRCVSPSVLQKVRTQVLPNGRSVTFPEAFPRMQSYKTADT